MYVTVVIILLLLLALISLFIYNRVMLVREKAMLGHQIGQRVTVDGNSMCIYSEGSGNRTLVFLSGSGTASPIVDFKPLYRCLNNDYRIAVIEKFGYGFSDTVDSERDFDTILRQDREALAKLGFTGKYVLCPHSMSGLEAILWAQKYPDEVEAIVGLDIALPRTYDNYDSRSAQRTMKLAALARILGIIRLYYNGSNLPEQLSKEDKRLYKAIGCRSAINKTVRNEGLAIPKACAEIDGAPLPDVPTLLFVSGGKPSRLALQREYASGLAEASVVELECGHYVHWYEYERISEEMKRFIAKLD